MTATVLHQVRPLEVPLASDQSADVEAGLRCVHGRLVGWFELRAHAGTGNGGGGIGEAETAALVRAVRSAVTAGVPVVGVVGELATDTTEGVAGLDGLGRLAMALVTASGQVPTVLVVSGPCSGGASLLLGLADVVVATPEAEAYVSGPESVRAWTGRHLDAAELGGSDVHLSRTGVAHLLATDVDHAVELAIEVLAHLPNNNLDTPPLRPTDDPADRPCDGLRAALPPSPASSYDVRHVLNEIVDDGDLLELRAGFAPNLVTALAAIDGLPVGIVANQPGHLAGTIDILASQKGARFVQWCDAMGVALLTVVDTPGFQPGKDLEWRGMIRIGAQLVHAYAQATVPRLCLITRKAFGGAYIVMDAKTMGNDVCLAWPTAQIAVMGAEGAVEILHRRELVDCGDAGSGAARRSELEVAYRDRFLNPATAARRGLVDAVIDPRDTRQVLAFALRALAAKREEHPRRRHSNIPL